MRTAAAQSTFLARGAKPSLFALEKRPYSVCQEVQRLVSLTAVMPRLPLFIYSDKHLPLIVSVLPYTASPLLDPIAKNFLPRFFLLDILPSSSILSIAYPNLLLQSSAKLSQLQLAHPLSNVDQLAKKPPSDYRFLAFPFTPSLPCSFIYSIDRRLSPPSRSPLVFHSIPAPPTTSACPHHLDAVPPSHF